MTDKSQAIEAGLDWREFLENKQPEVQFTCANAVTATERNLQETYLQTPSLKLRCSEEECLDVMWFDYEGSVQRCTVNRWVARNLSYRCRHCKKGSKLYAIYLKPAPGKSFYSPEELTHVLKIGEYPSFGSYTPPRVISLIGGDRDLFLKGRRAENRGLGIGAFAYYRRVVENQKNRILKEILKVARKVNASQALIAELEAAEREHQFATAIEKVKPGIPESLLLQGHNPLNLLHSALSKGLHDNNDETSLALAESIRLILTELAERIDATLKEHAELTSAVNRLVQENSKSKAT